MRRRKPNREQIATDILGSVWAQVATQLSQYSFAKSWSVQAAIGFGIETCGAKGLQRGLRRLQESNARIAGSREVPRCLAQFLKQA